MNSILNKEPVLRAEKSLKQFNPDFKVIVLKQTARTANDAATALGCKVGAIVKSLLFRAGNSFVLCLVSGDKRCSLNKLKKILDEKDVSMANPEDVKKVTGYTIGGVSPTGHLIKVKILNEKDVSMARPDDVKKITGYTIGGVSPTGHLTKIKIFIDKTLNRFSSIFAAAGHPNAVFKINYENLIALTSGEIKEITE